MGYDVILAEYTILQFAGFDVLNIYILFPFIIKIYDNQKHEMGAFFIQGQTSALH